ncbi:hypothetical protein L0U85_15615 [Glycomyces sp. L485]|uniref:hypothetical protein n=1 Tax=Glycomyces sp. L485 TaxID=2909235 RepID=UPI001F4BB923|nr:hypothetical protein [Glycomyces sp. L485]MCH7232271.1 hypothetical protein [Glycomyces sp. L485]
MLRAGEHEAIAEARSLLPLGTIRDVNGLAAAYVLAHLQQRGISGVVAYRGPVLVENTEDGFEPWSLADREGCGHLGGAPTGSRR